MARKKGKDGNRKKGAQLAGARLLSWNEYVIIAVVIAISAISKYPIKSFSGLQRDSNRWPLRSRCSALPAWAMKTHTLQFNCDGHIFISFVFPQFTSFNSVLLSWMLHFPYILAVFLYLRYLSEDSLLQSKNVSRSEKSSESFRIFFFNDFWNV